MEPGLKNKFLKQKEKMKMFEQIKKIVAENLNVEEESVTLEASF